MKGTDDEQHPDHAEYPVSSAEGFIGAQQTTESPQRYAACINDGKCEAFSAGYLSGKMSSAGHNRGNQAVDTNVFPTPTISNIAGFDAQDGTQASTCALSKSNTLDNGVSLNGTSTSAPQPHTLIEGGDNNGGFVSGDDSDDDTDDDSALGYEDDHSSTTSINSSITKHLEENGRTYHAFNAGACPFPNDEQEQNHLDAQHHLWTLTYDGKLFTCPYIRDDCHYVLDIGTGTGIWALDFGDEHPTAEVLGIDLSPIQPSFVAPNVIFQVDNAELDWTFKRKFDFIHIRMLAGSIKDWPRLIEQSFEFLAPGGYIELADLCWPVRCDDESMAGDSSLRKWSELMVQSSTFRGSPLDRFHLCKLQLEEAGFENVVETRYKWPQNKWPADRKHKDLGMWNLFKMTKNGGLQALSMALFTRYLGWSKAEVDVFLALVTEDLKNTQIHAYFDMNVVYGRKPR